MRKNEERKKHDRLSPDGFYQPVGGGRLLPLPINKQFKGKCLTAWRAFLLTSDDERRFSCASGRVAASCVMGLSERVVFAQGFFKVLKVAFPVTFRTAYIPVAGHILNRPQIFFFQPFRYYALPDLHRMFYLRVYPA